MRRLGMLVAAWVLCSLAARAASPPSDAPAPRADAPRPNILFLLSDDHSAPYLGCYGCDDVRTPTLDRLAADGIRFDRMFVGCPQCVPSRATWMTGRSPVSVRMVRFTSPLPPDVPALPDLLRDRGGYFTGVAGRSYHLDGPGGTGKRAAPVSAAVLEKHGLRTFLQRADYYDKTGAREYARQMAAFLDAAPKDKPWFFWLNFSDPHHPWDTRRADGGRPDPAKLTLPAHLPDLPGVRSDLAKYLAEIEHLDEDVAGVLAVLRERGLDQRTLVVFSGDNGMAMPHGKGSLYDPGIHVPLVIRWPGVVQPGRTTSALVSGEDFAPTLLEVAGVEAPAAMSGRSYLSILRGSDKPIREYIFAERGPHGGDGAMRPDVQASTFDLARCVRSSRFKLIYNCTPHQPVAPVDSQQDPSWQEMLAANHAGTLAAPFVQTYFTTPRPTYELYDLDADPGELNNLAGQSEYADEERQLKEALAEKMILDWDFLPLPVR